MTGQYIIQTIANELNSYMNSLVGSSSDKIIAMDTDSAYVHFGPLIEKYFSKVNDDQKIVDAIIKISETKFDPVLNTVTEKISRDLNFYSNKIYFKLEAISSNSIFLAKKRNCQKVLDNEGIRYSEPDYKITGIETNRSSTPDLVREWLTEAIRIVLDHSNRTMLMDYIQKRRNEFKAYSVEEISFPRSANNLLKYSDPNNIYTGGTPIAVRAALLYNNLVKVHGFEKDLELIREGDKIKYCALIEPNTLKENIIGYPSELPIQFNLHRYVDYDTQFEKAFLDPLEKIMEAMKWKLEEENSLCDFFM